jgi:hypothetical protein
MLSLKPKSFFTHLLLNHFSMNNKTFTLFLFIFLNTSLAQSQTTRIFDPGEYKLDSIERLKLCEPTYVLEYYYFHLRGEGMKSPDMKNSKSSDQILNEWNSVFKKPENFHQSGFLTVRFVVNCHLETCCFHFYEMDENYQPLAYDESIKTQLIAFIKNLNGWKTGEYQSQATNYFYYLNFVIKNGEFKRVSP